MVITLYCDCVCYAQWFQLAWIAHSYDEAWPMFNVVRDDVPVICRFTDLCFHSR